MTDDECMIHWMVPSKYYVGSVVPRWKTMRNRTDALKEAFRLIESGETDRVVLRSVEVIT